MITSTECERGETCSTPSPLLQPVLGTDKRNPIFSVCRQGGIAPSLHVYYGAELLEVVSEDRQHPAYKLLVARLYNAGVQTSVKPGFWSRGNRNLKSRFFAQF
jgi:hypothetical protein